MNAIAQEATGNSASAFNHVQLSAWKRGGAYRITALLADGAQWTAVYKDADYSLGDMPALEGLPAQPGPPERVVLAHAHELVPWVPGVYHWARHGPSRYSYILEDLAHEGRRAVPGDLEVVAGSLPGLHAALAAWFETLADSERRGFIRYDAAFSSALRQYAAHNVARYLEVSADEVASRLWRRWPELAAVHEEGRPTNMPEVPLHGDPNISNVHLVDGSVVYVDWEWAGIGVAHADLVSLTKRVTPSDEYRTVARYAAVATDWSPAEHRRCYEWCQLERGLLDAAFLSAQLVNSERRATFNVRRYVRDSLRRAVTSVRRIA